VGSRGSEGNLLSLIAFLAVLSVLVLIHEFGHFIVAKRIGVRIERFSFGFGPKLFSVKKGDTEYIVSAIPVGGYVKFAGDEPTEKLQNKPWEFPARSIFERFRIIFAGPLLNYILAFLIFSAIFMVGSPVMTTEIGAMLKDYPAQKAGLIVGDKVIAVDGRSVKYWEEMTDMIHKHAEGPIRFSIERNGKLYDKEIQPIVRKGKDVFGNEVRLALVGVAPSPQRIEKVRYGFFKSLYMGFNKLTELTVLTYKALWYLIIGRLSFKESMTGPIGIFMITAQAASLGLIYLLQFTAILSASLAIFNLLPIPALDGGHILFLIVEKVRGKPLSMKAQEFIANVGLWLLILLMLFLVYNDISKFGILDKAAKLFKH